MANRSRTIGLIAGFAVVFTASVAMASQFYYRYTPDSSTLESGPPIWSIDQSLVATPGSLFTHVLPEAEDGPGDFLFYAASGLPSWLSFYSDTRTLSGTPTSSGTYSFEVSVADHDHEPVTKLVTVTTNTPPVWNPTVSLDAKQGASFSTVVASASDADGDSLTYLAADLPSWLSFNASTRTLSGTAPSTRLSESFTITVSDGYTEVAKQFSFNTFTLYRYLTYTSNCTRPSTIT